MQRYALPLTNPTKINDTGQISGYIEAPGVYGFLEGAGTYTVINDPLADQSTGGMGSASVKNAGQIVGDYYDASGVRHGYLYSGSTFTTFDNPLANGITAARNNNNIGQIAEAYVDANGVVNGYVASPVATDKNDCNDGGWMTLLSADGSPFKNQGDCIQCVNTGK